MNTLVCLVFLGSGLAGSTHPVKDWPTGNWKVEFSNGVRETCTVSEEGVAKVEEPLRKSVGRVESKDGKVLIIFDDDRAERWTAVGHHYVVEHFFPASRMATVTPVLGIARRTR